MFAMALMMGGPPSVNLSPLSLSKAGAPSILLTTSVVTATGLPPGGTYSWTYVSGDSFTITAPSAASTAFSTTLAPGVNKSGVYRCTYTVNGVSVNKTMTVDFIDNVT